MNNDTMYAVTDQGTVYQSTDGGSTWTEKGDAGGGEFVDIAVVLVPEFEDLIIPLIGTVTILLFLRRRYKGQKRARNQVGKGKKTAN